VSVLSYEGWVASRGPTVLVFVIIGVLYQLVSERLNMGFGKVLLAAELALVVGMNVAAVRGCRWIVRLLSVGIMLLLTVVVISSTVGLLVYAPASKLEPVVLLKDAAVLWLANVLTFALWYWEMDGGGPERRAAEGYRSKDLVFPQCAGGEPPAHWAPGLVDYVFFAFSTAMAFSPTDTAVLSRRVKMLVMTQALISMLCVAVLAARAINML
jgi:hypothetical protein